MKTCRGRNSVLSTREQDAVNYFRDLGLTIKLIANAFGVSKDVIVDADPMRKAYKRGYYAGLRASKKSN